MVTNPDVPVRTMTVLRPLQNAPFCLPLLRDVRLNILHEVKL